MFTFVEIINDNMEIEKLISVFEKLLPIYKQACDQDLSKGALCANDLEDGLCHAAYAILNEDIGSVFENGYYRNFITCPTIYGTIRFLFPVANSGKDLKTRIDFMESEIKDLKRLIKKGYTDI